MERTLFVIADSHLGTTAGDVEKMARFIGSLDASTSIILFLGDLFHIWVGAPKYHSVPVKTLLKVISEYRENGGVVYLVAGNRDTILPEIRPGQTKKGLPFDCIAREFARIRLRDKRVFAFHGDTVNQNDKAYLRWRSFIRNNAFETLFKLFPSSFVNRLILKLERGMKQTNLKFKHSFPVEEWERFIQANVRAKSPDLILVGHFHPVDAIVETVESTTAIVVPDWFGQQIYMKINPDLTFDFLKYRD